MLQPHDRQLLLDALRPPVGYGLDEGIGTTYTLDLLALLTAPLGFTMFELEGTTPETLTDEDSLILLKTLRQYASRLSIFCQAGRISVPRGQGLLLSNLEQCVVEVAAPTEGGAFHPKLWALRFVAEGKPVMYRLLVLSRNLTFDSSWDTILVLDGELRERVNAVAMNHPLGALIESLPTMAVRELLPEVVERVSRFQRELRRVDFWTDLPEHVTDIAFHALGVEGYSKDPVPRNADRVLVMSPFLSNTRVKSLNTSENDVLISRADELAGLSPSTRSGFAQVLALNPAALEAVEDEALEDSSSAPLAGLHAKVTIAESGHEARMFCGSANATNASLTRNVEFVVELRGPRNRLGIDVLLHQADGGTGFRELLLPFNEQTSTDTPSEDELAAEEALDSVRNRIASVGWRADVSTVEGLFDVVLSPGRALALPTELAALRAYPIMLPATSAKSPDDQYRFAFTGISKLAVTSFFAFEVSVRVGQASLSSRFVVNAALHGAPADRQEALLRSLLDDRSKVLRFLLLLLADDQQSDQDGGVAISRPGLDRDLSSTHGEVALLETLLRTLHRYPSRLAEVDNLLRDLEATETPEQPLVPFGLREVLTPILAARRSQ